MPENKEEIRGISLTEEQWNGGVIPLIKAVWHASNKGAFNFSEHNDLLKAFKILNIEIDLENDQKADD